ncbi:RNA polymerase sigma factor [Sporosarcina sp. FSL K6-1522]|uniref:RNA polymerase sigma factor n=1 Tax=Sporosarcina sp. FSL K6-1522 TaxID=2921554 RepID=UPI00315A41CF
MLNTICRESKQPDCESYRRIFETYYERVYYAAYCVIKDPDLAQDVVQETFMKAFQHLHTVEDTEKIGAWLSTIATRTAIDHLRRMKRWSDCTMEDAFWERECCALTVETIVENALLKALLMREIDKLKPNYKEILIFHYLHDLKYEEISKLLDMHIGTVKTRVSRAKTKLKELIEQQPEIIEVMR